MSPAGLMPDPLWDPKRVPRAICLEERNWSPLILYS